MFQNILCAVDFSATSERAVEHAMAWAQHDDRTLELFHVVDPPIFMAPPERPELYFSIEESMVRDAEERMATLLARVRKTLPSATGRVARGFAAQLLVEHIGASAAELVVIGTHGRGAISRTILGSVADRVLRTSPVPVLLVPPDGRSVALRPKTIVMPTDFSEPAREALVVALAVANENDATLHVVHAYEIPSAVAQDASLARGLRAALAAQIGTEHPELSRHANVHTVAREGAAVATIAALTEEVKADLVVIASSGRGRISTLLGGVTDRVTRTVHVPVLVFRPR